MEWLENKLSTSTYIFLKKAVNKECFPTHQIEKALENSLYKVTLMKENQPIAMGRLVGDGVLYWYIQDITVHPDYQGQHIGYQLVNHLINYVKKHGLSDTTTTIGLLASEGKEGFYKKLGFIERPTPGFGAGMMKKIKIEA